MEGRAQVKRTTWVILSVNGSIELLANLQAKRVRAGKFDNDLATV